MSDTNFRLLDMLLIGADKLTDQERARGVSALREFCRLPAQGERQPNKDLCFDFVKAHGLTHRPIV
jgi:hypothetical protein